MDKLKGKKICVTAALPYANGSIHIGHLVEYIQTDIYVRFLKMLGHDAVYCCADDTHGTPIEFNAQKQGITPEKLIENAYKEHVKDFKDFLIEFDSFYSTNSEENRKFSEHFFEKAKEKGHIYQKEIELTYCEHDKRFLPDRFVKGTCPKCGAEDQYGDVCEKCNAAYDTIDLVDPYCTICKNKPVRKNSNHYFFKLAEYSDKLKDWLTNHPLLQKEVKNFVLNWIEDGLKDWCISRDGPYFGFKIPGEEDKYFYVWLDAPIGYIASLQNYLGGKDVDEYWKKDGGYITHFIGKDIIYFHFLFWPALLMAADFNLPNNIRVHGFLTVNKEKMSKSRGTFLTAREYLNALDPEFMRYYYAANLSSKLVDIDLDLNDFRDRINNELVANVINFIYRTISFANRNIDSKVGKIKDGLILDNVQKEMDNYKQCMENYEFREAVKHIQQMSTIGNKYFQDNEPWKNKDNPEAIIDVITVCVNIIKNLCIALNPILPKTTAEVYKLLGLEKPMWDDLSNDIEDITLGEIKPLMRKIDKELEIFKAPEQPVDFSLLNLKVALIKEAKPHPDADKLIVMQLDLGEEKRQIVAGLKEYYSPEELVGRKIVIVSNLESSKLRGEVSNGMLLAAEDEGKVLVLDPGDAKPGEQVIVKGFEPNTNKISYKEFAKITLNIKDCNVVYDNQNLKTDSGNVKVEGVSNKAVIR